MTQKILAALRGTAVELRAIKAAQKADKDLAKLSLGNLIRLALAKLLKIDLPPLKHGGAKRKTKPK